MMKKTITVLIFLLSFNSQAMEVTTQKKYPYTVLTNDYGILNEVDLDSLADGVYPPPFLPKIGFGYIYWQCFPRHHVSIELSDIGYSSEDIGGDENFGDLKITASNKSGEIHEYLMRRMRAVSDFEYQFNVWIKLMNGEKAVCIAGSFIQRDDRVFNGKSQATFLWDFDKIKTKKGCDSYFQGGCPISMVTK